MQITDKAELNGNYIMAADENEMRQLILGSEDRPEKLVDIDLWGRNGKPLRVCVRAMSGTQKAIYESNPRDPDTNRFKNLRFVYFDLVQMCCIHPVTKKPVLKAMDRDTFMDEKNGAIIDMLATEILSLSVASPSLVEDVRKNSATIPDSSATIASQSD